MGDDSGMTTKHDALFVYGTLMDEANRGRILGHGVSTVEARLDGFERRYGKYPYLVRADGAATLGMIMLGLTDEDWRRLDAYEDVPRLYTREEIEAVIADGPIRCWVYLPTPDWIKL